MCTSGLNACLANMCTWSIRAGRRLTLTMNRLPVVTLRHFKPAYVSLGSRRPYVSFGQLRTYRLSLAAAGTFVVTLQVLGC
jgi:hypothetical protein